jgi:hypothetical protein
MFGAPTDKELRELLTTATPDKREEIQDELDRRAERRATMRGHDPSLCCHPLRCVVTQ